MILLEGLLLVPPERGSIIGRAAWKPRYVVLRTAPPAVRSPPDPPVAAPDARLASPKTALGLRFTSASKPSLVVDVAPLEPPVALYLFIYKAKGDIDHLARHAVTAFDHSQIRLVQHRKAAPSLPTLMLEFKLDAAAERQRKRRSSRTSGLGSKDPWGNTLLFRDAPDDPNTIHDWNNKMQPCIAAAGAAPGSRDGAAPAKSPTARSITSVNFTNPFAQPRETRPRPEAHRGSSTQSMISTYPHAPRDRPTALISPSPSLRSRRSDLSSRASSNHPQPGFATVHPQNFPSTLPADLPSPASTSTSGYDSQFVEGWTSAQGRTSALSSHTRGSNSIASVAPITASTPPGPRETILDRAFQMRYIPGSDRPPTKDEERISSLARFEALMREADERKRQKAVAAQEGVNTSSWDLDEESEDESSAASDDEGLNMSSPDMSLRTPAQRALDYISGRITPLPASRPPVRPSPPVPYANRAVTDLQDGGSRGQPGNHSRRPNSLATTSRSVSTTAIPGLQDWHTGGLGPDRDSIERRRSGTSTKRLSFQEFAKRLSSTSSLLLVQTNASSSSGRDGSRPGSTEYGVDDDRPWRPTGGADRDRRRACHGTVGVGVFGGEGGFL